MYCNRLHCDLSTQACLARQAERDSDTGNRWAGIAPGVSYACFKCEQGKELGMPPVRKRRVYLETKDRPKRRGRPPKYQKKEELNHGRSNL